MAGKGDALVAGGLCQTSLYKHHKDEARIKKLFRLQLEVFVRKNVDFLIAEVSNIGKGVTLFCYNCTVFNFHEGTALPYALISSMELVKALFKCTQGVP